jgi:hypothetical protein
MKAEYITSNRLSNQHISLNSSMSPEDVLTSLGAVQTQEYPVALWANGLAVRLMQDWKPTARYYFRVEASQAEDSW